MSEVNLPSSWTRETIEGCCDLNPRVNKEQIADTKKVHFVPMPAVEALTNRIDTSTLRPFSEVKKGYTPFKSGDVIFAKITPCMENGKIAVVPDLDHYFAFGSTEFHVVRPRGGLLPDWFFLFLSSQRYRSDAEHNMTGAVGQRRVPIDFIAQSTIPLPPLAEQKRIVAKIEELFSELDAGEENLRRARRQLGVYRQSLLKQAFEGKLTAEWRAKRFEATAWTTVKLSEVLSGKPNNGRSVTDRAGGFRVLRLTALKDGFIDLSENKEGNWEASDAEGFIVKQGDFLVSRGNGSVKLVGRGGIVRENADVAFPDTMIRLPLNLTLVSSHYFSYIWNSEVIRRQIESSARTTAGIHKINQGVIVKYNIPLCALAEQLEIVRLLDEQFEALEQNEREIDAALKRSEALRQSILKKAFSGALVPQDPNDEPASMSLERIRAERESNKAPARKRAGTRQKVEKAATLVVTGFDPTRFPVLEMFKRGYFPERFGTDWSQVKKQKKEMLEAFFHGREKQPVWALNRQSPKGKSAVDFDAMQAWRCRVLDLAAQQQVSGYDVSKITPDFLRKLAQLSKEPKGPLLMAERLREAGIAVVIEKHFEHTYLDGAALRGSDGNPVIALTLRFDRIDNFVFTLFHELGHVVKHFDNGGQENFIDTNMQTPSEKEIEVEADEFARHALIPEAQWPSLKTLTDDQQIRFAASRLAIHSGIIAGRLQRETGDYTKHNSLLGQGEVRKLFGLE